MGDMSELYDLEIERDFEEEPCVLPIKGVYRETDKALLIEDSFGRFWVAKSIIIEQTPDTLVIPHWTKVNYSTVFGPVTITIQG